MFFPCITVALLFGSGKFRVAFGRKFARHSTSRLCFTMRSKVYASQRVPEDEGDMNSRINSIFIACLFLMVNAQVSCSHQPSHSAFDLKSASLPTPLYYCAKNTVLKVFETERNMFYIHKGSKMYTSQSILRAYTVAVCLLQCSFSCLVGTVLSL